VTIYIKGWRRHIPKRGICHKCNKKFNGLKMSFAYPYTGASGHNAFEFACRECLVKIIGEENVKRLEEDNG